MADEMADEIAMNGGDQTLEISESEDPKASKLMRKIEALEQEKSDLSLENDAVRERITTLEGEIGALESEKTELRREIGSLERDKKTLEADGVIANNEVIELKREVERLKESGEVMRVNCELLERQKDCLLKEFGETEERLRNEVGEEKKKQTNKSDELLLAVEKKDEEIEKLKKERDELKGAKGRLEGLLEKSEKRVNEMEEKIGQLGKDLEESELVISGLKEKTLNGINGIHVIEDGEKRIYGPKLQWPVFAISTGLVVTVGALWYLRARQR